MNALLQMFMVGRSLCPAFLVQGLFCSFLDSLLRTGAQPVAQVWRACYAGQGNRLLSCVQPDVGLCQTKSRSSRCNFCRVKNIRLFTVPSGMLSCWAISRYLKPDRCMEKGVRYSQGSALTMRRISFRS